MSSKKVLKRLRESRSPEVGIFFFINGKIYGWGDPVREMRPVQGFYDSPLTHMEYFDELVDVFPELHLTHLDDYALYPRGRVIYSDDTQRFKVYADRCILNDPAKVSQVIEEFNLPREKTDFEWDDHYVCKDCDSSLQEVADLNKAAALSDK